MHHKKKTCGLQENDPCILEVMKFARMSLAVELPMFIFLSNWLMILIGWDDSFPLVISFKQNLQCAVLTLS